MPVIRVRVKRRGRETTKILEALSASNVRAVVIPKAALAIQALVRREFVQERDPYGKRWKRKKVPDGRPVLTGETRQLRRNISSRTTTSGFRIHANTPYASFHQSGTGRMPQRKIFPVSSDGLPRKWKQTISAIAGVQIRKLSR